MIRYFRIWPLLVATLVAIVGCDSATDAPPVFGDVLNQLVEVDVEIQRQLAADPPGDPHDLVHDAGRLAVALAEVDSTDGLNATQCMEVHNVSQDLLSAYSTLDASIESGESPDYEAVRDRIQKGLVALQKVENALP